MSPQGVITITEANGTVTAVTVRDVIALARTRNSRGVQVGDGNQQFNSFR